MFLSKSVTCPAYRRLDPNGDLICGEEIAGAVEIVDEKA